MNNLDNIIDSLKAEITDIYLKINKGDTLYSILDTYELYNINMIKYIKSKDLQTFIFWFNMIKFTINSNNPSKEYLEQELNNDSDNNEQFTSYVVKFIFKNLILYDNIEPSFVENNDSLNIFIDPNENRESDIDPDKRFRLNDSQQQVLDYYNSRGLKNGIICHATGTGKTICAFITMGKIINNSIDDNKTIFLLCNYINILRQTFYDSNDVFDYKLFRNLNKIGVFNLWLYDIYDLTDIKKRDNIIKNINNIKKSTNNKIFIINSQYIANEPRNRFMSLPIPDLIIFDECHCITAHNTYKLLSYYANDRTKIIGLSATPIRNLKSDINYDKLKHIFSEDGNDINLISSYENIKAIIKGDILNIEIFWFEALLNDTSTNNKINEQNIDNCIRTICQVLNKMVNKKLLLWCGTIEHTKNMYKHLIQKLSDYGINAIEYAEGQNYDDNDIIPIFIDHSKVDDLSIYKKFKPLKNGIIVCADKYREGSDIKYLGCVTMADFVKNKSSLVFIQCIGRVQRKGTDKSVGYVIDHIDVSSTQQNKINDIVKKIIGYYNDFFSNTSSNNNIVQQYSDILKRFNFTEFADQKIIVLKLNDELNMKIHTGIININFNIIEEQFNNTIIQQFAETNKLSQDDILKLEYEHFKIKNENFCIHTDIEYGQRVLEFKLVPEPKIKYANCWKNWYDYLGINTSIYPETITEWKNKCKLLRVRTEERYKNICKKEKLPLMPNELYGSHFTNIDEELNV
jgi:superfamily II DNA or RNA helicase